MQRWSELQCSPACNCIISFVSASCFADFESFIVSCHHVYTHFKSLNQTISCMKTPQIFTPWRHISKFQISLIVCKKLCEVNYSNHFISLQKERSTTQTELTEKKKNVANLLIGLTCLRDPLFASAYKSITFWFEKKSSRPK